MVDRRFVSAVPTLPDSRDGSPVRLQDFSGMAKVLVKAAPKAKAYVQLRGVAMGASVNRLGALICGVRPNEWLLLGEREAVIVAVADLDTSGPMAVTDVTHGRTLVRLSGPSARPVLNTLCSLDLGDRMTPDGAVTTTTVARIRCEVIRNDQALVGGPADPLADSETGSPSYLLCVDSSYGSYFAAAVMDAMDDLA